MNPYPKNICKHAISQCAVFVLYLLLVARTRPHLMWSHDFSSQENGAMAEYCILIGWEMTHPLAGFNHEVQQASLTRVGGG